MGNKLSCLSTKDNCSNVNKFSYFPILGLSGEVPFAGIIEIMWRFQTKAVRFNFEPLFFFFSLLVSKSETLLDHDSCKCT